ncbi:MAG: site-specific integrase, partial [Alphaproteobacteria bacterium]|nr:site-specific integrase [Alphaproteobacteria bacterium]
LRGQDGIAARALEFAILTAARTSEATNAGWSEFDLAAGVWTVPAERIKTKRKHSVPLSKPVLALLAKLPREGDWVFPGGRLGRPLSNNALLMLLRRMERGDITAHGFRSTFRDWAAERTNYPREVCEMALAHAIGDKVEAAYRRGDLFEKRQRLMAEWATYCDRIEGTGAGTVTALRER